MFIIKLLSTFLVLSLIIMLGKRLKSSEFLNEAVSLQFRNSETITKLHQSASLPKS